MKKLIFSFFLSLVLAIISSGVVFAEGDKAILYYGNGCSHCAKVEKFMQDNVFGIEIEKKEIYQNQDNAEEFNEVCDKEGVDLMSRGVPFLYAEGECVVGDEPIISYLQEHGDMKGKEVVGIGSGQREEKSSNALTLPILIGAAFVDSINPCEFAVLLILMTTVLAAGSKKRALFSGIAYSVSIFISYFLMGLGLYSIISSAGTTAVFMKVVGWVAIVIGVFNLKDFFWYGKIFVMEVPLSWRPRLKAIVRSMTGPVSAFFVGFLVSLFLLPCTSGPYIVILGMLGHGETYLKAVLLLLLYNLIFILPMVGITVAAYFGMSIERAEETRIRNLKILHLIAGVIMVVMGIFLLIG
jgi:cytochrome c biogenesis protein CcdA